jgi:uncharacterized protein (TIGR02611 family)
MTGMLPRDIQVGSSPRQPIRRFLRRRRAWVERHPRLRWAYRFGVAALGASVAMVGLILVPMPGPGWLIVFLGIGILGTEFPSAARFGVYLKRALTRAWKWWNSRRVA